MKKIPDTDETPRPRPSTPGEVMKVVKDNKTSAIIATAVICLIVYSLLG